MPKGLEVELALLGIKGTAAAAYARTTVDDMALATESVELLAAVAEIDVDQTPPCCLEIAQLVRSGCLVQFIFPLILVFVYYHSAVVCPYV